jgi:hypothetical protein
MAMDMDERWVRRSPEVMLDEFHWFRGEAFDLIVEDLLGLPADRRVLVEGFRLLPGLVEPMLADRRRAAWLIPTPAFRLAAFTRRGGLMEIAGRTSDPEHALRNLLLRDAMFTSRVEKEVARRGLCALAVDGAMTIEDLSARVAERFDL